MPRAAAPDAADRTAETIDACRAALALPAAPPDARRTAKDLGHVYWTAGSALYRAPIGKASGAVMLAPAVGRSSVGRHRSVVGRADRSLACSLAPR